MAALTKEEKKEVQKKNLAEFKVIAAAERAQSKPSIDIAELRKNRPDRRKESVGKLRRRWGQLLADEKGAAELRRHSFRIAALQRIRALAESGKDGKTVEACDELLTREDERHFNAMNALREGALPGATK